MVHIGCELKSCQILDAPVPCIKSRSQCSHCSNSNWSIGTLAKYLCYCCTQGSDRGCEQMYPVACPVPAPLAACQLTLGNQARKLYPGNSMSMRPVSYFHSHYLTPTNLYSVTLCSLESSPRRLRSLTQPQRRRMQRPPVPENTSWNREIGSMSSTAPPRLCQCHPIPIHIFAQEYVHL